MKSRTLFSFFVFSFFVIVAIATSTPAQALDAVPDFIRHHETASPQINESAPFARSAGDAPLEVRIDALDRVFEFVLRPDPILAPDARVLWVGADGVVEDNTNVPTIYSGELAGDPEATVRLEFIDGSLNGIVLSEGEKYFFEPASRYNARSAAGATLVYKASDTTPRKEALGCGVGEAAHDLGQAVQRSTPRLGIGGGGTGLLEMGLVGDYELYQKHGGNTASHLLSLISLVDAIYMSELDVTIQVTELVIYTAANDPFSSTTSSEQLLYEFRDHRAEPGNPVGDTGLGHLLSGRDFSGSTIGIAYVGVLCSRNYGVGISEDFSSNNFSMSLLLSHEIGHNFGAGHDGNSPCGSSGFGNIMWPSLGGGMIDEFSACSKSVMASAITAASCILPAVPQSCGDGILDVGEDCDDGNNVSGDCCRLDCQLESFGSICGTDGDECTDDICNGSGSCQKFNNTAPCQDGDICTTAGQCGGGTCQPSSEPLLLDRVKLKAKFKNGENNDQLNFKANVPTDGYVSLPSVAGATFEILTPEGVSLYSSFIPPHMWEVKGSSGASFKFASYGPVPGTGGMSKAGIKYKVSRGYLQIKGKTKGIDLPTLVDRGALRFVIQVGDSVLGDCGEVPVLSCGVKPGAMTSCQTP
jgi:cysteine-rich repeat protein